MTNEKTGLLADEETGADAGPRRPVRGRGKSRWEFFLALGLVVVATLGCLRMAAAGLTAVIRFPPPHSGGGAPATPPPNGPDLSSGDFDTYKHLGHLSPFFEPPNDPQSLKSGVPPGCTASRAFLIHRHGSRHAHEEELEVIRDLADYIKKHRATFSSPEEELPATWSFLQEGWDADAFVVDDLTAPGRQQLFDHGVGFRLALPDLHPGKGATAGDEDRVIESAHWFLAGYHGRSDKSEGAAVSAASSDKLNIIPEEEGFVSWITPHKACEAWDEETGSEPTETWGRVYLPPITARINDVLQAAYPRGANFTPAHVHGMFWACAYGTAIFGAGGSPWCGVFEPDEIRANEYEYDLRQRGFSGYGLPGDMGAVLGGLLVSNVTDFLTREDEKKDGKEQKTLSLNFGHDKTLAFGLTALGLAHDEEFPVEGPVDPHRRWRSARLVMFASYMLWKRLECDGAEGQQSRIQLVLNGANFGLGPTSCEVDEYGTCALDDFLDAERVRAALNVTHGDARWAAACKA